MTTVGFTTVVPDEDRYRVTPLVAVQDILAVTKRNILRLTRIPQLVVFSTVQPVMFVLLFRYVFGGAIPVRDFPYPYVDYLMAGIFIQTILFGATNTAIGMSADLKGGIIDRFRSLPMASSAVLAGRTLADLARSAFVALLIVVVGTAVGFRFHAGFIAGVAAIALVLAFGFSFMWIFAVIGLSVKEPETAQVVGFVPMFPFVFASSAFVPVASMPGWLQGFANVQPVSVTVNAVRALTQGGETFHWVWQSVAWTAGILVVFIPLAVHKYRKN